MKLGRLDVWDVTTFDKVLLAYLQENVDLIRNYIEVDRQQLLEREASKLRFHYPENPFASAWIALQENIMPYMAERSIRAWHYTRLTNNEVQALVREGPKLSNMDGIRGRLAAQVEAGEFSSNVADQLLRDSPFHKQDDIRSGRFWMTSHPIEVASGLVDLLVGHWGGEGVYFWQSNPVLISILQRIGIGRVVELEVPLDAASHTFRAASAVISTYARSIGCRFQRSAFDMCVYRPLGPKSILAVHSDGDAKFDIIGREYPERFLACDEE